MEVKPEKLHALCQITANTIKQKTGKGPKDIKGYILPTLIVIEMCDYLTPMEAEIVADQEGMELVKRIRDSLFQKVSNEYIETIRDSLNINILRASISWSIEHNEAFILLVYNN